VGDEVDFVAIADGFYGVYFLFEEYGCVDVGLVPVIWKREKVFFFFVAVDCERVDKVVVGMGDRIDEPLTIMLRRAEDTGDDDDRG